MEITALQRCRVDVANLPLDRVAASTQLSESEKVAQASRAFEAVLLRQILSECHKPAFPSKLISDSSISGIYRDMIVDQMADSISKSGSFGLAKSLAGELQRQSTAKEGSEQPAALATPPSPFIHRKQ